MTPAAGSPAGAGERVIKFSRPHNDERLLLLLRIYLTLRDYNLFIIHYATREMGIKWYGLIVFRPAVVGRKNQTAAATSAL